MQHANLCVKVCEKLHWYPASCRLRLADACAKEGFVLSGPATTSPGGPAGNSRKDHLQTTSGVAAHHHRPGQATPSEEFAARVIGFQTALCSCRYGCKIVSLGLNPARLVPVSSGPSIAIILISELQAQIGPLRSGKRCSDAGSNPPAVDSAQHFSTANPAPAFWGNFNATLGRFVLSLWQSLCKLQLHR